MYQIWCVGIPLIRKLSLFFLCQSSTWLNSFSRPSFHNKPAYRLLNHCSSFIILVVSLIWSVSLPNSFIVFYKTSELVLLFSSNSGTFLTSSHCFNVPYQCFILLLYLWYGITFNTSNNQHNSNHKLEKPNTHQTADFSHCFFQLHLTPGSLKESNSCSVHPHSGVATFASALYDDWTVTPIWI